MASFIKITTTANIGTGIGFFINPEKIVSVQSDGGDQSITLVSFILPLSSGLVFQLEIDCNPGTTPAGEFPITRAMNAAIETAISNPGVVVDFNAILKTIAVDDLVVLDVFPANF
jgi:hypothetical protein